MNNKLLILMAALLTVSSLFLTGFVSAALSIDAPANITVNHNSDATISFRIINTGDTNYNSLNWADSTTSGTGTWKVLPLDTQLAASQTKTVAAVLSIPRQTRGSFTATLNLKNGAELLDSHDIAVRINDSPSLSVTKTRELTTTSDGIVNIANTGNIPLTNIELSSTGDFNVAFSSNNLNLPVGSSSIVNVSGLDLSELKFGRKSVTIAARDINSNNTSGTVIFSVDKGFCRFGEAGGNLTINDVNVDNSEGEDDVWKPLDEITVEVKVENNGDDKIKDVFVELGLFDSNGDNLANDLDFINDEEDKIDVGDLNDGDDDTVTFNFRIPADLNDEGNFKLAVKVFSKKSGERIECTHSSSDLDNNIFDNIEIQREDDEGKFIAFDNIALKPNEATCSDTINLDLDVFNVGNDKEDQVKVNLVNSKLNLDLTREIKDDLDEGDKKKVEFSFTIPQNTADGSYNLELNSEYDYRRGTYRQSSDDTTSVPLKVFGCSIVSNKKKVAISAFLDSDAKAGGEMLVKATITNIGDVATDFVVAASGFESWGKLNSISNRIFNLKKDESKEITLKFNVNQDATGEQSFTLEVRSGDVLETREIVVNIIKEEEQEPFKLNLGGNSLIWIIGAINIVLIILIIVVAVRISRR